MADDKRHDAGAAALAISVPTAIGLAYALLRGQKVEAGDYVLPEEVIQLLIAMAATSDETKEAVLAILARLAENGGSGVVQGWPTNTDSLTALRVMVGVAGTRMPSIVIPSGMTLVIKAWALNPGWLQVGASIAECTNVNQSFPLLPNEVVTYQIQNADQIYIAGTIGGCFACLTVEQRRNGGV